MDCGAGEGGDFKRASPPLRFPRNNDGGEAGATEKSARFGRRAKTPGAAAAACAPASNAQRPSPPVLHLPRQGSKASRASWTPAQERARERPAQQARERPRAEELKGKGASGHRVGANQSQSRVTAQARRRPLRCRREVRGPFLHPAAQAPPAVAAATRGSTAPRPPRGSSPYWCWCWCCSRRLSARAGRAPTHARDTDAVVRPRARAAVPSSASDTDRSNHPPTTQPHTRDPSKCDRARP